MGDIEKLDMSLDDIIKKSSDKKPKAGAAPSQRTRIQQKRRGGLTVRGRGARGAKAAGKTARAPISVAKSGGVGVRGRGVLKASRGRGALRGRGLLRRGGPAGLRRAAPRDRAAVTGAAKWKHDLYEQTTTAAQGAGAQRQGQGATLLISNLNYNVSDDDIKELFSSIGELISYGINYDRSGRSEGTAQVVYRRKDHALAAMNRYNNVALDNLKMVISLREPSNPNVLTTLSSGISVTSLGRGGGRAGGRGGGRAVQAPKSVQSFGGRGGAGGRGRRGGRGRGGGGRGRSAGKGGDGMDIDS